MGEKKESSTVDVGADNKSASDNVGDSGKASKRARQSSDDKKKEAGARVHHRYHDRTEDTVAVTRDDLREVRDLGIIHQVLFGVGVFFFSGAFWQLVQLLTEQKQFEFTAWMGMYLVSIFSGAILAAVGAYIFHSKQRRLAKYFPCDEQQAA